MFVAGVRVVEFGTKPIRNKHARQLNPVQSRQLVSNETLCIYTAVDTIFHLRLRWFYNVKKCRLIRLHSFAVRIFIEFS